MPRNPTPLRYLVDIPTKDRLKATEKEMELQQSFVGDPETNDRTYQGEDPQEAVNKTYRKY